MSKFNNTLFYIKSFLSNGISPKGVHWSSAFTQNIRFEVITSFFIHEINKVDLIDAGCGFGDYYLYLKKYNILPKNYIGIEKEIFFSKIAKNRTKQKIITTDILKGNLPKADYYIASGSLNILEKKDFFKFIEICYGYGKKGFIFNFLTKKQFINISKEEVLQFCNNITNNFLIKEDYLEHDCSIFLKK